MRKNSMVMLSNEWQMMDKAKCKMQRTKMLMKRDQNWSRARQESVAGKGEELKQGYAWWHKAPPSWRWMLYCNEEETTSRNNLQLLFISETVDHALLRTAVHLRVDTIEGQIRRPITKNWIRCHLVTNCSTCPNCQAKLEADYADLLFIYQLAR